MTTASTHSRSPTAATPARTPRLGFLGVGWIGRHRMDAILRTGAGRAVAVMDPAPEAALAAAESTRNSARICTDLDDLLNQHLDGLIIATPSALHAQQAIAALDRGIAVFCQKPLARTGAETRAVVEAARRADRLLGVDFSYRFSTAFQAIHDLIRRGELGNLFALDLTFHNAYGPDKPWFRDPSLSGGGCVIDLGIHLVDLAMRALQPRPSAAQPQPPITIPDIQSHLYHAGRLLPPLAATVEDYATATLRTDSGATIRLACSWNLHAGQDAIIAADFHGDRGGAAIRNVNGSFYDFTAEHFTGASRRTLAAPPDDWGGRAAVHWARQLAQSPRFDPHIESTIHVADIIDRMYGRA